MFFFFFEKLQEKDKEDTIILWHNNISFSGTQLGELMKKKYVPCLQKPA